MPLAVVAVMDSCVAPGDMPSDTAPSGSHAHDEFAESSRGCNVWASGERQWGGLEATRRSTHA